MKIDNLTKRNISSAQQTLIKYYNEDLQEEYFNDILSISNYLKKTCPNIVFLCSGRIKSLNSSLEKVERKVIKEHATGRLYDIYGIKLIIYSYKGNTDEASLSNACYELESSLLNYCNLYNDNISPITEKHKDYIKEPKSSGYQALHNILSHRNNFYSEIQLRTFRMEEHQLNGASSHFTNYKSNRNLSDYNSIPNFLVFPDNSNKIYKLSDYMSKQKYLELINFAKKQAIKYSENKNFTTSGYRRRSKKILKNRKGIER